MSAAPAEVIIIGGAATGSSVAYHLLSNPDFRGRVVVVEPDATYRKAASALSAGSIRQQFSSAINVRISLHGIAFLRGIGQLLELDGERPDVQLHEGGYLFLATAAGRAVLAENLSTQTRLGADIAFLERGDLARRFPWLATHDLAAGCLGRSGEGWFDGYSLTMALRRKARSLGTEYLAASVASIELQGQRATGVRLTDGSVLHAGAIVNAAGTHAADLLRIAGFELPVHRRKRMVFRFDCPRHVTSCPLVIDPSGVYFRPEGPGFICGASPADYDPDVDADDFDVQHGFFEEIIWPRLAERVPAFEELKVTTAWAGHYDFNTFDHNALVGYVPGFENLLLANGFSGHGLQQSPAVGRGISELLIYGSYLTLDLTPLACERILERRPLLERSVV